VTLLVTECSASGVAMAADSAITKFDAKGNIVEVDQQGWRKVLRAPGIIAAVGYWGFIGKIHRGRFVLYAACASLPAPRGTIRGFASCWPCLTPRGNIAIPR
jgi:hypothetical protein